MAECVPSMREALGFDPQLWKKEKMSKVPEPEVILQKFSFTIPANKMKNLKAIPPTKILKCLRENLTFSRTLSRKKKKCSTVRGMYLVCRFQDNVIFPKLTHSVQS